MTDVLLLVMISWLAGLATGISAARLSSWIYHIRQRRCRRAFARFADPRLGVPFDEGRVQRGNGSGGPTTPKPNIIPKPQPAGGRLIREGEWRAEWASINDEGSFSLGLVRARNPSTGYQPRSQGGPTNPPPKEP